MASTSHPDRVEPRAHIGEAEAQVLQELSSIVLSHSSFAAVLEQATVAGRSAIPGADEISVTMRSGSGPTTAAASGPLAAAVDESQYDTGHGPCLEAMATGRTVLVSDLTTEQRWPAYVPRALEAGVRSSLSLPLVVDGHSVGAFNIYATTVGAFDDDATRALACGLAGYAGIVLNNAELYFTATSLADHMAMAMQSRAVIEQAKGILMASRRCSPDEAFDILVRLSQQTHRKLRDVAKALVHEATGDA